MIQAKEVIVAHMTNSAKNHKTRTSFLVFVERVIKVQKAGFGLFLIWEARLKLLTRIWKREQSAMNKYLTANKNKKNKAMHGKVTKINDELKETLIQLMFKK